MENNLVPPRPYQTDLLKSVRDGWKTFHKQLVVAPTGAGKTLAFSWMAKEEHDAGRRTLILVDQDELVWQTVDKLKRATGIEGQVEKAEYSASKHATVVIATIQSMARRLANWPADHFSLVIADEGDKSITDMWQKVLSYFDPTARICAFTATPMRTDKRSLGEYYENIPYEISLLELINLGFLSPICIQMAPLKIDLTDVHLEKGDYDLNELDHAITPYLASAVQAIKDFASDRKTLVFLPLIKTSEKFVELCRDAGLLAEHIDGKSDDRAEILERYKRNEFSILANSSLLTRGYDDPEIDCVFVLRPTKSATLFRQCIGRGTRIADGKKNLLLIDCLWQTGKHMVCRPAHLIATSQEEADEMSKLSEEQANAMPSDVAEQLPIDLIGLQSTAQSEREISLRKRLEAMADRKAKFISAEEFAVRHHRMDIAEFEPVMKWHSDPITDKQLPYLERAGVNVDTVKGKGHANQILSVYFEQLGREPASSKQRWVMRKAGWVSPDGRRTADQATQKDARDFFTKKEGRE